MSQHVETDLCPTLCESPTCDAILPATTVPSKISAPKNPMENHAHCQGIWDRHTKKSTPAYREYAKVAVLMLFWKETDLDQPAYNKEIEDLAKVFEQDYGYMVVKHQIDSSRKPQQVLHKGLIDFLHDHDDKNTLLITYYAGHGYEQAGTKTKKSRFNIYDKTDSETKAGVSWTAAEALLTDESVEADVLSIFDCCHAGSLCENPRGLRSFEVLAACPASKNTRKAGKESFTTALIWALGELKNGEPYDRTWFRVSELMAKLLEAPDFPRNQHPVHGKRASHENDIMLAPADHLVSAQAKKQREDKKEPLRVNCRFLDVRLRFPEGLDEMVLEKTSKALQSLVPRDTNASEVIFLKVHTSHTSSSRWNYVRELMRSEPHRFRRSLDHKIQSSTQELRPKPLMKPLLVVPAGTSTPPPSDNDRDNDDHSHDEAEHVFSDPLVSRFAPVDAHDFNSVKTLLDSRLADLENTILNRPPEHTMFSAILDHFGRFRGFSV